MQNRSRLFGTVVAAAICSSLVGAATLKDDESFKAGSTAPNFTLTDQDGVSHTLSDYRGKLVILDWWGMWCGPCVAGLPKVQKLHEQYQNDSDVIVLAMNVMDDNKKLNAWWEDKGYTFPTLHDADELSQKHGIMGFPTTTVIGPDGTVVRHGIGSAYEYASTIESALKDMAAGRAIAIDENAQGSSFGDMGDMQDMMGGFAMPESIKEFRDQMREMFPLRDVHEPLKLFTGEWSAKQTMYMMGDMGPSLSEAALLRYQNAGRHVVGHLQLKDDDSPATFVIGFDDQTGEYYLHYFDSLQPSPTIWKGTWDAETRSLTFEDTGNIFGQDNAQMNVEVIGDGQNIQLNADDMQIIDGNIEVHGEGDVQIMDMEGMQDMGGVQMIMPTLSMVFAFAQDGTHTIRTVLSFDDEDMQMMGMDGDQVAEEIVARRIEEL